MLTREAFEDFIDFLNPESFASIDGIIIPVEQRVLLSDAPESAVKAFADFKKLMEDANKQGIRL